MIGSGGGYCSDKGIIDYTKFHLLRLPPKFFFFPSFLFTVYGSYSVTFTTRFAWTKYPWVSPSSLFIKSSWEYGCL